MTRNRVSYTDIFNFDDYWFIREGLVHGSNTKFYVISCQHKMILEMAPLPWYFVKGESHSECDKCGPIPDKVLTTFNLL